MAHKLIVKDGVLASIRRGHPWIFADSVAKTDGLPGPGEAVEVTDFRGRFAAWAWYAPESRVRARVISRDQDDRPEDEWLERTVAVALSRREPLMAGEESPALRLINGEADGLPGLFVDRYGPVAVVAALSAGAEAVKELVAGQLLARPGLEAVYERSDGEERRLEGLKTSTGWLAGSGLDRPVRVDFQGLTLGVDYQRGDGTGLYLDRRPMAAAVARLAAGRRVLDLYCYQGLMSLAALKAGASQAMLLDMSGRALKQARENLKLNNLKTGRNGARPAQNNVYDGLRRLGREGERFDLIVIDPPRLAAGRAGAQMALKTYDRLIEEASELLNGEGVIVSISSTPGVDSPRLEELIRPGSGGRAMIPQILARFGPEPDFPLLHGLPEFDQLSGVAVRLARPGFDLDPRSVRGEN